TAPARPPGSTARLDRSGSTALGPTARATSRTCARRHAVFAKRACRIAHVGEWGGGRVTGLHVIDISTYYRYIDETVDLPAEQDPQTSEGHIHAPLHQRQEARPPRSQARTRARPGRFRSRLRPGRSRTRTRLRPGRSRSRLRPGRARTRTRLRPPRWRPRPWGPGTPARRRPRRDPGPAGRGAAQRLPAHERDRRAQRRSVTAERRLRLPGPGAARG